MRIIDLRLPSVRRTRSKRRRIDLGNGRALVWPAKAERPHYEHLCEILRRPRPAIRKRTAPTLHPDHVVTNWGPNVTVRASILCPGCKDHGFVTDGQWTDA